MLAPSSLWKSQAPAVSGEPKLKWRAVQAKAGVLSHANPQASCALCSRNGNPESFQYRSRIYTYQTAVLTQLGPQSSNFSDDPLGQDLLTKCLFNGCVM